MSQTQNANPVPARAAVDSLDPRKVGEILINAGTTSALAGHSRPQSTMRDYVNPSCPESEFVRVNMSRTTNEIVDRWYGGELEAAARASSAIADVLGSGVQRT